jgi:hypothetical protein
MYIKICNLIQSDGYADYKGLDISKIVSGSQIYPSDENVAYFQYISEESMPDNPDIVIIDDITYKAILEEKLSNDYNRGIEDLKKKDVDLQQAVDDLTLQLGDALLGGAI